MKPLSTNALVDKPTLKLQIGFAAIIESSLVNRSNCSAYLFGDTPRDRVTIALQIVKMCAPTDALNFTLGESG